ncbi:MAG TPA: CHASE2 domain-containing protein, partial [Terriglobales bacterium]|nr:CHASE2 domain-containing protein [Terriglobales bacterium]
MNLLRQLVARLAALPARHVSLAISLAVTLAGLLVFTFANVSGDPRPGFAFVQHIELRSLDARFNLRAPRPPDPRIVIVDIDEKTLQRIGAYPIARSAYARLIDRLHQDGARLVAFDVAFPTPEKNSAVEALTRLETEVGSNAPPPVRQKIAALRTSSDNDRLLAESMQRAGNVILGHVFLGPERAEAVSPEAAEAYFNVAWGEAFPNVHPLKTGVAFNMGEAWAEHGGQVASAVEANIVPLAEAARSFGFINNDPDADGTMRRAPLLIRYQDLDWYPSLAFQVVREGLEIPDQDLVAHIADTGLERIEFGPYTLRPRLDSTVLINYAGAYGTYPHYSMVDVIEGSVPAATFRDKLVLLGPTAL